MPFSQKTKENVRRRAWFACCICKRISLSLEVHHILPQAAGGSDLEENAAPLCASCHRSFGGNPDHRARVGQMRDHWYEACQALFRGDSDPNDVIRSVHELFSLEELERLAVHNPTYTLGRTSDGRIDTTRFSFSNEEYVHPRILKELLGWTSDSGATVVGVDLETANRSNRFHGGFAVGNDPETTKVRWEDGASAFGYTHVATTPSGVEIVECHDCLGGSGVFGTIALFSLERDRALRGAAEPPSVRDRSVLKILGQFPLGDRYRGNISYGNGLLTVGPDRGWFNRGEEAAWRLPVL